MGIICKNYKIDFKTELHQYKETTICKFKILYEKYKIVGGGDLCINTNEYKH